MHGCTYVWVYVWVCAGVGTCVAGGKGTGVVVPAADSEHSATNTNPCSVAGVQHTHTHTHTTSRSVRQAIPLVVNRTHQPMEQPPPLHPQTQCYMRTNAHQSDCKCAAMKDKEGGAPGHKPVHTQPSPTTRCVCVCVGLAIPIPAHTQQDISAATAAVGALLLL